MNNLLPRAYHLAGKSLSYISDTKDNLAGQKVARLDLDVEPVNRLPENSEIHKAAKHPPLDQTRERFSLIA
jgi:hypothetical protein